MTELLERAIARLRERPPKEQDRTAAAILDMLGGHEDDYVLTPEQIEKVRRTQEGVRNGSIKILDEIAVEEMWRRLGA